MNGYIGINPVKEWSSVIFH